LTKRLLSRLTARKQIYVIAGEVRGSVFIRVAISSRLCEKEDIEFAWKEIQAQATVVQNQEQDDDLNVSETVARRSIEEELFIGKKEDTNDFIESFSGLNLSIHADPLGR